MESSVLSLRTTSFSTYVKWGHQELVLVETCVKAHYLQVKDTLAKVFSTDW